MLHQDIWSVHISPRFILTVFHIDNPIKHMSALYLQWTCLFCKFVTQNTNTLGPGWPLAVLAEDLSPGWIVGSLNFSHIFYDKRNKHKYYRTIPHQLRGNTDIIYLSTTWPKFWEQKFYANKVGSNFHNICKYNQKLLILRNMRITDCTLLMRGTKRPFRCLDLISYKLGSHVQFCIHCDKLGNSMGLKREGGITLWILFSKPTSKSFLLTLWAMDNLTFCRYKMDVALIMRVVCLCQTALPFQYL